MSTPHARPETLDTDFGAIPLRESRLRLAGRAWAILHAGAVLTRDDESRVIGESRERLPYGVALWPAAIALAHEVAARAADLRGAPAADRRLRAAKGDRRVARGAAGR